MLYRGDETVLEIAGRSISKSQFHLLFGEQASKSGNFIGNENNGGILHE